jgi:hypothetical protein
MAHDVFVSYATEDKPTADAVCARLEQQGIRCWIAPRDILPGVGWKASIVGAIEDARALVLVFTAHSNASPEVAKEIAQAAQHGLSIVTFRLEDVPLARALKYDLDAIHWLDALTPPVERHIDQLASKLRVVLDKSPTPDRLPPVAPPASRPVRASRGLLVAGAIVVLLASAAVGWFVARGTAGPPPVTQSGTATAGQSDSASKRDGSANPNPVPPPVEPPPLEPTVKNRETKQRRPDPIPVRKDADSDGGSDGSGTAPEAPLRVLGCWGAAGAPGVLEIRGDGSYVSGGVLTGRWTAIDAARQLIVLQFADEVGQAQLSPDGRRLSLSGMVNDTLSRPAGGSDVAGQWTFSNGLPATVEPGGALRSAAIVAKVKLVDARTYAVVWPGFRYSTSVSADGEALTLTDSRYGAFRGCSAARAPGSNRPGRASFV